MGGPWRPWLGAEVLVCSCRTHSNASIAASSSNPRPASTTTPWPSIVPRYCPSLWPPHTPRQEQGPADLPGWPCLQPCDADTSPGGEQEERERLRKVLKQMGRLRCSREVSAIPGTKTWGCGGMLTSDPDPNPQGCGAAFSSLMGYQYHQRRCGKPPCEVDSPSFPCAHCGKTYRSKAGHDYHVRSEHTAPVSSHARQMPPWGPCPLPAWWVTVSFGVPIF